MLQKQACLCNKSQRACGYIQYTWLYTVYIAMSRSYTISCLYIENPIVMDIKALIYKNQVSYLANTAYTDKALPIAEIVNNISCAPVCINFLNTGRNVITSR